MKIKHDQFLRARGGTYKIYDIYCENCGGYLFEYQKDGPGILKRLYYDRISKTASESIQWLDEARCWHCGRTFGTPYIYEKEQRPAIRLFVGSLKKKYVR